MKPIHLAVVISLALVAGAVLLSQLKPANNDPPPSTENVQIVDGQQIIDITAKGGYSPRVSAAKAGVPTILRFHTAGTLDCSAYIRIPSLDILKYLPSTGTTDIAIANPKIGVLQGMCGMGMYPFQINFEN